jgi:aquaporin Z
MSGKLVAQSLIEFIGTFVFLSVILSVVNGKVALGGLAVALGLAAVIFFDGGVSGGNFNPAVSFMLALEGKNKPLQTVAYIVAQLLGAAAACGFSKYIITPMAK